MINYLNDVRVFMHKHKQPYSYVPSLVNDSLAEFRIELIREEFQEYIDAVQIGNIYLIADALADLKYVIFGADLTYGIPADSIFDIVHTSNMSKDKLSSNLASGGVKVQKSLRYKPPTNGIKQIIDQVIRMSLR